MKLIRTVTGDIAPENLGWCQCHEHLYIENGKAYECNPVLRMEDAGRSLRELQDYAKAGGKAYVDAQPVWSGRMAELMGPASEASGVSIIASTGYHKQCFYYEDSPLFTSTDDELYRTFRADIEEGMLSSVKAGLFRTAYKAGIVKLALDHDGVGAPRYARLLKAALAAAADTGVEVMAHFEPEADAFELLREMERAGLPPQRLIACHLDRTHPRADYINEVAAADAYLDFDTVHRYKYHGDAEELALIRSVLEAGNGNRLMLSLDTTAARLRSYGGEPGLDHILTGFRGKLAEAGVDEGELRRMMIENPARALAMERPDGQ